MVASRPMSASASWVKPLLEVLESKTSVKVLGAVFVITLAALRLPRSWKDQIYMTPWVSWLWPWLVVICAFCGLMLLFIGIDHFIIAPRSAHRTARIKSDPAKKGIETYFKNLSRDEIEKLSQYAEGNYTSRSFFPNDGIVHGLIHKGILYEASNKSVTLFPGAQPMFPYNVTDLAAPYLRKERFQQIVNEITKREQEARQASTGDRSGQKP